MIHARFCLRVFFENVVSSNYRTFFQGQILCLLAPVRFLGSKQSKLSVAVKEKAINWVSTRSHLAGYKTRLRKPERPKEG